MSPTALLPLVGLEPDQRDVLTTVGAAVGTAGIDGVLLRSDEIHALLRAAMALIARANEALQQEVVT